MAAEKNNNYAAYSLEEIKVLIAAYVKHIASGYSQESFIDCDYRTIASHLEKYAKDLQSEKRELEKARRKGRHFWEKIGMMGTLGATTIKDADGNIHQLKAFNATSWIFNMKNRYAQEWREKQEIETSGGINITLNRQVIDGD